TAAPWLADWKRWRLAETPAADIVRASTLLRQLIVMIDRSTGRVSHAATRPRWATSWTPIPLDEPETAEPEADADAGGRAIR
ncbi:MAG: hypothetical protein AAF596_10965, partial [Planctomycetota bacterium]